MGNLGFLLKKPILRQESKGKDCNLPEMHCSSDSLPHTDLSELFWAEWQQAPLHVPGGVKVGCPVMTAELSSEGTPETPVEGFAPLTHVRHFAATTAGAGQSWARCCVGKAGSRWRSRVQAREMMHSMSSKFLQEIC